MEDAQNIFYTSISRYYSQIFPYQAAQLGFVEESLAVLSRKKLLDIGCASGQLAFQLASKGAEVTGIDLNEDLLARAQQKFQLPKLSFQIGDMLEISHDFNPSSFDAVLCFGNTLVHLPSTESIQQMLAGLKSVIKPGGLFLLQILNYDYIIDKRVTELPLIETDEIIFRRSYRFSNDDTRVKFCTELFVKSAGRSIKNETDLLALKSHQLRNALLEAGFSNVNFFSNFKGNPAGGEHLPLVVHCS